MCGIAGYCLKQPQRSDAKRFDRMIDAIRKRGPDDEGVTLFLRQDRQWQDFSTDRTVRSLERPLPVISESGVNVLHDTAFFHSRYAILDLSAKGHQPFHSSDGSTTLIFNGEIYNYQEIKEELLSLGVRFKTQCDTEVIAEGYARWKDGLWAKLNGFWAIVLYDHADGAVVLCRDRLGVSPLYYRETSNGLFFSSYIKPLVEIDGQRAPVDDMVVEGFLQTGLKDIAGETYYQGIKTFPAATVIRLPQGQCSLSKGTALKYWQMPQTRWSMDHLSIDEAVKRFREIFFNAVTIRLRADVNLAFELSGGLDSSSVVAAAAQLSKTKITTYTAKIQGADEEPYARAIQEMYDIDYRVISDLKDSFSKEFRAFSDLMEEPYDNPNDHTHFQMLKMMKAGGAQVVITGAGGDEVFAGYESSFWPKAYREWRSVDRWQADQHEFQRRFRNWKNTRRTLIHYMLDPWRKIFPPHKSPDAAGRKHMTPALQAQEIYKKLSFDEQRRFHFNTALLPYYMRSSDHFTMGIPVEHRFPLLDYRLVEFGLQLPVPYLFRDGWTKYILRKAMEPHLPKKIIWRREKMGFQFPYALYFQKNRAVFEPVLEGFYRSCSQYGHLGGYQGLLTRDPLMLWRVLSTAIWMDQDQKVGSS